MKKKKLRKLRQQEKNIQNEIIDKVNYSLSVLAESLIRKCYDIKENS